MCYITGGNWSTWRNPVVFGRIKLEAALLTCDWREIIITQLYMAGNQTWYERLVH
jgi:hypothetical protein